MADGANRTRLEVQTGEPGRVIRSQQSTGASVGGQLPGLVLRSTRDRDVDLARESLEKHLVLFFYPGDLEGLRYPELSGCTPQACSFRDNVGVLRQLGAEVFGVNLHPSNRQKSFAKREHLSFELLSDSEQALVTQLGVPLWTSEDGEVFVSRTTIVVRRGGAIAKIFDDVQPIGHVVDVVSSVRAL